MERVTGIEPAWPAWKAGALPLSYTRERKSASTIGIITRKPKGSPFDSAKSYTESEHDYPHLLEIWRPRIVFRKACT